MLYDIGYALRTLRQNPGFALTAIISIALAIGANSAIFSLQDGLLFRPLGIENPSDVVTISGRPQGGGIEAFSYPDFIELRDKNRSFTGIVGYRLLATGFAKDTSTQPQFQVGLLVSGNFFDLLGIKLTLGRGFRPDEDSVPGRDAVVVLSHDFWAAEFGSDPAVIGRRVRLGPGRAPEFTVVGVAPETFTGMDLFIRPAYYVPAVMGPGLLNMNDLLSARKGGPVENGFNLKGRLKPGVSVESANADVAALASALEKTFPESNRGRRAVVRTEIQSRLDFSPIIGGIAAAVSGIMFVILVVASANVANLMLGRGRARAREISIRLAIGSGRSRVIRQLMSESLVIALAGGALGLLIASSAVRLFETLEVPGDAPIKFAFELDSRVLVFTFVVSVFSAVLFGLIPAFHSTKTDLATTLKAGESAIARKRFFGRNALVAVQIAGAVLMLMAAGQMYRNVSRAITEHPGFFTDNRLTVRLDPSVAGYTTSQTEQFYRTLLDRVRGLPGVRSAGRSTGLPMTSDAFVARTVPEGYQFPEGQQNMAVRSNTVDESYFSTFGIPIIAGRAFQSSDELASPRVAIVNAEFARRAFNGDALGRRIRLEDNNDGWMEIVGITATGKYQAVTEPPSPHLYLSLRQNPSSRTTVAMETAGDPGAMATSIRNTIRDIDPTMPVLTVRTMDEIFQRGAVAQTRVIMAVFTVSSTLGFLLAVVGLYAVVSFQVSRRTREIGIRMSLGARRHQILKMILSRAAIVSGIGIVIGVLLSVAIRPALIAGMGQRASSFDPSMLVMIPCILLLSALFAAGLPASTAARIDPQRALRQD